MARRERETVFKNVFHCVTLSDTEALIFENNPSKQEELKMDA